VAVEAFDPGNVDDDFQGFFWLLFAKNFDLIEKPQRILRTIGIADEPLMEARVACARASLGEDVATTKASRATILFNPTALAFGADCSEST
jgi:hypothetical protein